MTTTATDSGSLTVFRVLFGALLFASVARMFAYGWIDAYYIAPRFFFGFFSWLKPWPAAGMYVHYAVMGVAALGIMSGILYRLSLGVFFALFVFVELLDKTTYLNHYYLVSLLLALLLVLPKPSAARSMPLAALWIVRAQIGIVYVFAGLAKLNSDWLLRAEPLRFWLARAGGLLEAPWLAFAASWAGAAFDLLIVPALLWRVTRAYAFTAVVAFHVATAALFNIGLFPWIMIAAATLFLPSDWPRRFLGPIRLVEPARMLQPAWFLLLLAFEAALPGDDRFAWRVMLQERSGVADFTVVDRSGRQFEVEPRLELTPLQTRMMSIQRDMLVQYGKHLVSRFAADGVQVQSVYVRSRVSINGHASQPLIPDDVDLLTL